MTCPPTPSGITAAPTPAATSVATDHRAVPPADLDEFRRSAFEWLSAHAERCDPDDAPREWGEGSDNVAVFHALTDDEERSLLEDAMQWQRTKYDAGFGALSWPRELGGAGLDAAHEEAFAELECGFVTPSLHETFSVTVHLVAPTLRAFATEELLTELLRRFLRTEELCCQLFSEPEAGSDLAGLRTRGVRDGDAWIVNGQKTWSSGARFSAYGELICRTDPDRTKHTGLTAFIVPMDTPGITVVPIKQMSGGASFNEVFFDDVRIPDRLRLGEVGDGWRVALTTLGFERGNRSGHAVGGSWRRLHELAQWCGASADATVRNELARLYTLDRIAQLTFLRARTASATGAAPGPEGSIGKLQWTQAMTAVGELAGRLLGPRLVADTGEWGTYAWSEHVLGAPGYRIAGGSDEIQRNILAERVLRLPRAPQVDRDLPGKGCCA